MYEMVTGKKAFEGTTHASVIAAILERPVPPPSRLVPGALGQLDRLVAKCLAKDPDDRWYSARDVGAALQWIEDERQHRPPASEETAVAPGSARSVPRSGAVGVLWELTIGRFKIKWVLSFGPVAVVVMAAAFGYDRFVTRPAELDGIRQTAGLELANGEREAALQAIVSGLNEAPGDAELAQMMRQLETAARREALEAQQRSTEVNAPEVAAAVYARAVEAQEQAGTLATSGSPEQSVSTYWRAAELFDGAATIGAEQLVVVPDSRSPTVSPQTGAVSYGRVQIVGTQSFEIWQGDQSLSPGPAAEYGLQLPVGSTTLTFRNDDLFLDKSVSFEVLENQSLSIVVGFGVLMVRSQPANCEILVDGQRVGYAPLEFRAVAEGMHTVARECPDEEQNLSQQVSIEADAAVWVTLTPR